MESNKELEQINEIAHTLVGHRGGGRAVRHVFLTIAIYPVVKTNNSGTE